LWPQIMSYITDFDSCRIYCVSLTLFLLVNSYGFDPKAYNTPETLLKQTQRLHARRENTLVDEGTSVYFRNIVRTRRLLNFN